MQSTPLPCYLFPLTPNYPIQHLILEHPQPMFLSVTDQVSYPHKTTGKITVLHTLIFTLLESKLGDKRFCTEWLEAFPWLQYARDFFMNRISICQGRAWEDTEWRLGAMRYALSHFYALDGSTRRGTGLRGPQRGRILVRNRLYSGGPNRSKFCVVLLGPRICAHISRSTSCFLCSSPNSEF
jgi:hypothetical protein